MYGTECKLKWPPSKLANFLVKLPKKHRPQSGRNSHLKFNEFRTQVKRMNGRMKRLGNRRQSGAKRSLSGDMVLSIRRHLEDPEAAQIGGAATLCIMDDLPLGSWLPQCSVLHIPCLRWIQFVTSQLTNVLGKCHKLCSIRMSCTALANYQECPTTTTTRSIKNECNSHS